MTFLEELWASVEKPDLSFLRRMQAAVPSSLLNPAVLSPSGEVIPCDMTTLLIWQMKFPDAIRVVRTLVRKIEVSTVFLPIAVADQHFETLLLSGPRSGGWRYSTLKEARRGHRKIVRGIRDGKLEDL